MITVLGLRRLIVLSVLAVFNAALGFASFGYLQPEIVSKESELRSQRSSASSLRRDLNKISVEFEQLEDQKAEFGALQSHGFFSNQNRREAEELLQVIREQSKVISATVSIDAGRLEDNKEAEKADHIILSSDVDISVEAMDDVDVMRYVYLLERFFPGHFRVETLSFKRSADINGTVLRSISSGENVPLVEAQISGSWKTMIPEPEDADEEGGRR